MQSCYFSITAIMSLSIRNKNNYKNNLLLLHSQIIKFYQASMRLLFIHSIIHCKTFMHPLSCFFNFIRHSPTAFKFKAIHCDTKHSREHNFNFMHAQLALLSYSCIHPCIRNGLLAQ